MVGEVDERRVWRLCCQQRLLSSTSRKGRYHRRPGPAVHDDLVRRNFTEPAPSVVMLTDISEHPTLEESSIAARSKTCHRTGSSATRSPIG
jgi:putative transposase